ncbi:hypothetical protein ABZ614_17505 [Streptomyces sp. NPDC013178]|uniref:hypothetical protein n=1 Tax=unclassified Streptomyces TaxID=2593676 RepID=UPI0033DBBA9A
MTRWEWNGSERRRGTEPDARADAFAAAAGVGDFGEGADGPVSPSGEPGRTAVVDGSGGQGALWT